MMTDDRDAHIAALEADLAERTRERDEHAKWRMALADKLHDRETEIAEARADAERMRDAANRIEGDDVLARLRSGNATPEDQYNVANSLAYLWAQDGLLSEAQREVDQLRDQLAEVGRPLDAQMARLNANLVAANRARMDAERELDAARADAARYRWLRNDALQFLVSGPICVAADKWGTPLTQYPNHDAAKGPAMPITLDGKELDAAIDAVMKD